MLSDQPRGDLVTTAAIREELDDLVVRKRDDEYRHRNRNGEIESEMGVLSQREIGFLGTVSGRRQSVRAQADPGEKSDQRDAVSGLRIERVARLADDRFAQSRQSGHADVLSDFVQRFA